MTTRANGASAETIPGLAESLDEARANAEAPLTRSDVAEIIAEVIGTMEGDLTSLDFKIYRELDSLAKYIQAARSEIAQIRPDEISADFIPSATDELDAVVGATEEATGTILDTAEQIQNIAATLEGDVSDQLMTHTINIFEACNFQDITGQRITKVVNTLKHIENKIDTLVNVLGEEVAKARSSGAAQSADAADVDMSLLNGPQLPDKAIDQDEIDRLLAEFD
ncbi:protein phosphatase CheZ [Fodinicurvata sp. EGI_FJ10296]|uniref:protein phosphatase CheZ n=1 Tax=Fodinicurvata sp. EGI_FJ10296 TaxID=3231908 RepID=UPI0034556578